MSSAAESVGRELEALWTDAEEESVFPEFARRREGGPESSEDDG